MATTIGCPRGPERTRALLEEIAGGRRGVQLRAQVLGAKRGATREQVEEAFQEACLKAARGCRGQTMGEVYTWLRMATDSGVDDMRDRLKREVLVDHSTAQFPAVDASLAPPDELLIRREERAELDALTVAILDRLAERERKVATLHCHGLARKEIAGRLGVTPRVVKRCVEEVLATSRDQLTRLVGYGCPDGHELIARYAFGLAAAGDARRAQLHLMACARCGAMYEALDLWRERVAALLPVPPAVEAHAHVLERVVHAGSDLFSAGHAPAPDRIWGLRRHVADTAAHLREQAAAISSRTVDPTPIAGARPGAVAAVVAGCLAVGGGATYCVQQGADPFAVLGGLPAPSHQQHKPKSQPQHKPKSHPKRVYIAQTPAAPRVTPTATASPRTVRQPAPPAPTPMPTTAAPAPAPQDEFEPTSAAASSGTSAQGTQSSSSKPAPAPTGGPGEFDGP